MRKLLLPVTLLAALSLLPATPAAAAKQSIKKSIWGPVVRGGKSQFPIYRDLGAGLFQMQLVWANVAPTRPVNPTNPRDPAYNWPRDVGRATREARKYRMQVSLTVAATPPWANGNRSRAWAPNRASDYADFLEAAAKKYRRVRHWMVWGEPSRAANFKPLPRGKAKGPRRYARLLDKSYVRLKKVRRSNKVIGGNTFTTGDIRPRRFMRWMRLPNGRRPRMDMYGHNPFGRREPDLRKPPMGHGFADFSDLDTLARWLDGYGYRRPANKKRLRLFLSEYFAPTDHSNHEFNFWVDRKTQARWLKSGLRITRRWRRIYTLGWFRLHDDRPRRDGQEVNRGLLTYRGKKKPSYFAFRRG